MRVGNGIIKKKKRNSQPAVQYASAYNVSAVITNCKGTTDYLILGHLLSSHILPFTKNNNKNTKHKTKGKQGNRGGEHVWFIIIYCVSFYHTTQ